MNEVLGTAGLEAADRISVAGFQLVMLASVALFLGALRLVLAKRSRARILLAAGTLGLAIGVTLLLLESYGAVELDYYPEWKKDAAAAEEMPVPEGEFVPGMGEEELALEELSFSGPDWWEGPWWWGERLLRLGGIALAAAGFYLEARTLLQEGKGRRT